MLKLSLKTFYNKLQFITEYLIIINLQVFDLLMNGSDLIKKVADNTKLFRTKMTAAVSALCDELEGLCMLLKRLSYPCRYGDMIYRFTKPVPFLSMITNQMIDYVYKNRVLNWNHEVLSPINLQFTSPPKFESLHFAIPQPIIVPRRDTLVGEPPPPYPGM